MPEIRLNVAGVPRFLLGSRNLEHSSRLYASAMKSKAISQKRKRTEIQILSGWMCRTYGNRNRSAVGRTETNSVECVVSLKER